jgi:Domain of unknown function (DUF4262)
MCMRCDGYSPEEDGYSPEEIERHTDLVIRVHGFMMLQVEADPAWTYTIGARESWSRPELIMIDTDADTQRLLIRALADDYAMFGDIRTSTGRMLDLELVPVHEAHFRCGLVAAWEERYSMSAAAGDFLQVVPGPSWFRGQPGSTARRLDARDAPR